MSARAPALHLVDMVGNHDNRISASRTKTTKTTMTTGATKPRQRERGARFVRDCLLSVADGWMDCCAGVICAQNVIVM